MGFRDLLFNLSCTKVGTKITETKDNIRYSKVGWAVSDAKDCIKDTTSKITTTITDPIQTQKTLIEIQHHDKIEAIKHLSHSIVPIPAPKDWKYPKLNTELYPEPGLGAPIFCDLGFGYIDHSGIYIGNNRVVQLNGKGSIEEVSLDGFTSNITTVNKKVVVPADRYTGAPISFMDSYERALEMVGNRRNYNMIIDNCHQFTAGCVTGDFEEQNNFLVFLKSTVGEQYGSKITWRRWYWHSKFLHKIHL
ncbi:hypothetical protein bcgnr5378_07090 [Bacillus cereus]|uniref:LRAT domain-containing protein n=1 Tax=Bacillus cereus TaxID=1396 RepID=A0A164NXF2_BACCE|nr:lecithin retinol acyltransferase family protein [Bacillus cereus]KZD65965.1 hypothetical protein B4088_2722 [Bacillus cereus]